MALSFDGYSSKVVIDTSTVLDNTSNYSVNFKIQLTDLTAAYERCLSYREGARGFQVVQEDDKLFIFGDGASSVNWGTDTDASTGGTNTALQSLSTGTWYNVTVNFTPGATYTVPTVWLDGVAVTNDGDSALGGSAAGYASGVDLDAITLGARNATGTTVLVPSDCVLAELTIWQEHRVIADAVSMTSGTSGSTIGTPVIHYQGLDNTDTTETVNSKTVTFTNTVVDFTHPTITDPGTVSVPAGTLTYTGYTPTVNIGSSFSVAVPAATLTYTGYAPTVNTAATLTMESDDFDSAIGTVSSITNASTSTPTINLTPDDQSDVPGWLMLCVRSASNMSGKTPEFVYSDADCRFTGTQNPCWRYLTDDRNTWYAFDNVATVTNTVTCSMNTPFTGEIEFATKPRWHYSDTQDWIAEVALDADAHELASSVAATTLPTNVFASVDPGATNANTFPQQDINLYGIRISNDAASPAEGSKWPVVLLMGQHASEDQGNYMLQGFVDYLLSGTTLADRLLVDYDFYIYDVNPHGRAYGKERWSENDTTNSDLNRAWDGVPSGTVVDDIISAIGTDITGTIRGMIDFHGNFQATRSFGAYYDPTNVHDVNFKTKMASYVTEGFYPYYGDNVAGTSGEWALNEGALFAPTQEAEYYPIGHPNISSMYDQQGEALAQTLDELRDEYYTIVQPAAATLTYTGYAPVVQVGGNQTVQVPAATLTYTGYAPVVPAPLSISVPAATLTYTGYSPDIRIGVNISVGAGTLTYTGYVPTVNITNSVSVSVPSATLTYTGYAPAIVGNDHQLVQPGAATLTYTGYSPSVEIDYAKRVAFWGTAEVIPDDPNSGLGFWNN